MARRLARRLRNLLPALLADRRGVATVELAVVLPVVFVIFGLGSYETWRMVLAHQKMDRTTSTMTDLAGRLVSPVQERQVTALLQGVSVVASPFDLQADGRAILSAVGDDGTGNVVVLWQRCSGSLTGKSSGLGGEGSAVNLNPLGVPNPSSDNAVLVAEVFYSHSLLFNTDVVTPIAYERRAFALGRLRTPKVIDSGGDVSGC